jgi:hypothetical protein
MGKKTLRCLRTAQMLRTATVQIPIGCQVSFHFRAAGTAFSQEGGCIAMGVNEHNRFMPVTALQGRATSDCFTSAARL